MTKGNIIILGAGYGGIRVAQQLSKLLKNRQDFKIILVNKDYYHTLMTQLYEPAVGTKACSDVVIPLSEILEGSNISLVKGTVSLINLKARSIVINDTSEIPFQYLVIALGSMPEYFGIEGLKENSMSLSSFDHACDINNRINEILLKHKGNGEKPLNFVVGGGGLTGVEFTGELASYLEEKRQEYNLSKDQYKIIIIEAANQLLPGMSEETANYAKETLEKLGVEVIISDLISRVVPGSLHLKSGRDIEFSLLIWAGGIRGSSVLAQSGIKQTTVADCW